jgi:hypothetical protein
MWIDLLFLMLAFLLPQNLRGHHDDDHYQYDSPQPFFHCSQSLSEKQENHSRKSVFRRLSVCEQHCLPHVFSRGDILKHEMRNICSGNLSCSNTCEISENTVMTCQWPVCQKTGSDDDPISVASPDQLFLPVFVFINRFQQQGIDDSIIAESARPQLSTAPMPMTQIRRLRLVSRSCHDSNISSQAVAEIS